MQNQRKINKELQAKYAVQLSYLNQLHDNGVINEEEFKRIQKIIRKNNKILEIIY